MAKKKESPKKDSKKIREPIREKNKVALKEQPKKESSKKKDSKPKKAEVKKEEKVKESKKTQEKSNNSNIIKFVAIGLGIIFIILLLIFILDKSVTNTPIAENKIPTENLNLENLEVFVISNSGCEFCQEELVIQDLKILLNNSNLSINELEFNSEEAVMYKETLIENNLNFDFSPIFILSKELEVHPLFNETQFQALFIQAGDLYILNPQITQIKYTDETIEIPSEVISIGNPQGVSITYISDYFCSRCNIMEGKPEIIETAQLQGVIPQNYSAPIPQLLLSSLYANISDLSFNFNFIPAPISENSTNAHKAAYCAHKQDSFVQMHATLINDENLRLNYTINDYLNLAQELGLNSNDFESCYNNEAENYINTTQEYLIEMGIAALPITIVGHYPSTELMDAQTMALLLNSELNLTTE